MQKKEGILIIFLAIIVIFILSSNNLNFTGLAVRTNLLQNPGFEEDENEDGIPDFWTLHNRGIVRGLTINEKYQGTKAFKFEVTEFYDKPYGIESEIITVKPNTLYNFRAYVKTENIEGRNFYIGVRCGNKGVERTVIKKDNEILGTNNWTELYFKIKTGQTNSCFLLATFDPQTTGTVWIDQARFIEIREISCGDSICDKDETPEICPEDCKIDFCSLGSIPSQEEEKEIMWNDPYYKYGQERQLGSKDEDHRTIYGIIIKNPKLNSASDQVVLEIPNEQVQANISIRDKSNNQISEDIPINKGIADPNTSFKSVLEDHHLPGLLDTTISFKGNDYDVREVVILPKSKKAIGPETSLTSASTVEDDYESGVYLEAAKDSIGYYYAFDEAINASKATAAEPLEIKILGKTFKIIDASNISQNKFTAIVDAEEYLLNVGDSVIIAGKTITLENVGTSGSIIVSVDEKLETISSGGTEIVNGIGIYNDETFYESNKEQRSAKLIMKEGDVFNTFKDGDPFYGGDEVCRDNNPDDLDCWEWDIANLASNKATEVPQNGDAADIIGKGIGNNNNGTIIGVQNDFTINDDTDNPPGLGECLNIPYNYLGICFDSLTIPDTDYTTYTFEFEKSTDLSEAGDGFSTQTSEPTIYIHTDVDNGLILKSNNIFSNNLLEDKTTKKIWLSINNTDTNTIDIFYEDENNKVQYAGYTTEIENKEIIQINYLNTTSNNINIDSIEKENQDYFFRFSIKGDNPNELEQEQLAINFNSCII